MFSPGSPGAPNIALVTLVCGWVFASVAMLAIGLLVWSRKIQRRNLGRKDFIIFVAFAITIVLVVQTTWAIVDDGDDKNVGELSYKERALIVRICIWDAG